MPGGMAPPAKTMGAPTIIAGAAGRPKSRVSQARVPTVGAAPPSGPQPDVASVVVTSVAAASTGMLASTGIVASAGVVASGAGAVSGVELSVGPASGAATS